MKKHILLLLLGISLAFTGCDDDDDKNLTKGDILIGTILTNPDGSSGSGYMQLVSGLSAKSLDNSSAFPVPYLSGVFNYGEDIFVLPGHGDSDMLEKYTRNSNGELGKTGQLSLPPSAGAYIMCKQSDGKAYVTLWQKGLIWIINPKTMTKTGEIDVSSYGVGDSNPDPLGMVIRDGKLFVALSQNVGGYLPDVSRPYTDVLIIDTATDQVEKMITETASGLSTPTNTYDRKTMFVDENNDIYIVCLGAYGFAPGHKSGVLRIKSGETGFDNGYIFTINDATIQGEPNSADYIFKVQYVGNGKLYAIVNIPAYYSNPPDVYKDRTNVPVLIDLNTRTVQKLNFPRSSAYASISVYDSKVIYGLITDSDNGFYTYDTQSGTASSESVIKTTGYPTHFIHFGEKYH